jgi:hypothetical protein
VRECPKCRTAVRVNRLDEFEEDKSRIEKLIGKYQECINQNDLMAAKKALKEITVINRTIDSQEISVFIKTQRKELMKMESTSKQKIAF